MEIHDPGEWHDVRHVREPCEQRGERKAFPVKKVTSSRSKNKTTVIAETKLDEDALCSATPATGYDVGEIRKEP